ncbi:MAG: ElyC/SanA/YdcF family protein [Verrucomicrobiota bacterium]
MAYSRPVDFVFAFKKLVSTFLFPIPLISLTLFAGGILHLVSGRRPSLRRWSTRFLLLSGLLFLLFSSRPLASGWLHWLETKVPHYAEKLSGDRPLPSPAYIVVLGGDHSTDPQLPPALRVGPRSMLRLSCGLVEWHKHPESQIIVTGGKVQREETTSIAADMAALLRLWGVPSEAIFIEEESRDTKDHVRFLEDRLRGKSFVLVTSASHLPRAMWLFQSAGLTPLPCPAHFYTRGNPPSNRVLALLPSLQALAYSEMAAYETMGLLWAKLRGQI